MSCEKANSYFNLLFQKPSLAHLINTIFSKFFYYSRFFNKVNFKLTKISVFLQMQSDIDAIVREELRHEQLWMREYFTSAQ